VAGGQVTRFQAAYLSEGELRSLAAELGYQARRSGGIGFGRGQAERGWQITGA